MDPRSTAEYWDQKVSESPTSWMQPTVVRHYINAQISGNPHVWPLEWFREYLAGRSFHRVLSIGCGAGAFERSLIDLGIARAIDAFDASVASVALAEAVARVAGLQSRIRYFVSDFNRPALPRDTYDCVCFHQSLHHVAKLEKLLKAVLRTLKPGGLLYLEEPIGPSRHEWTEKSLEPYDRLYQQFPEEARWFDYIPFPIEWNDDSEAVRSGDIVAQMRVGFRIREFRGYGGNVLSVLVPALVPAAITPAVLDQLIERDREAVAESQRHFHAVIVAQPKKGVVESRIAALRYYATSKIKWLARSALRAVIPQRSVIRKERRLLHKLP